MFATGVTIGLAEWIMDDTPVLFLIYLYNSYLVVILNRFVSFRILSWIWLFLVILHFRNTKVPLFLEHQLLFLPAFVS